MQPVETIAAEFERLDDRFAKIGGDSRVERLFAGGRWTGALSRSSEKLRTIRVPVSLIWGEADTVTPIAQGKRISDLTRARTMQVLPGVGHIPHIEDPRRFKAALDRALNALPREGK